MVDICDHHRAIRSHYETSIFPVIYWAASNYFLGWGGCHLQEHLLLRRGHELIFMEGLLGRVQSSEHEPELRVTSWKCNVPQEGRQERSCVDMVLMAAAFSEFLDRVTSALQLPPKS